MILKMNGNTGPDDYRRAFFFQVACLLAVFLTAAAGCASAPLYRTHPELPQRKSTIKTAGLLPPMITMYEEQYKFGLNKLIPHDDWSPGAAEAVRKAFLDETAAIRMPLKFIDGEDRELNDMADLFSAVDFSIQRHVYDTNLKEMFPEKALSFDYSLGPAWEMMDRHQVDAVWIVTGFNLLPTTGAQVGDAVQHFVAILSALGGGPGVAFTLKKIELRAALVDKSGEIVFYTKLDESNVPRAGRNADSLTVLHGEYTDQGAEEGSLKKDIRDPRVARQYIRALLSEYRKAVAQ